MMLVRQSGENEIETMGLEGYHHFLVRTRLIMATKAQKGSFLR
jgi:hypothetical protein